MLKKLVFTFIGLLLIYCMKPNKLEIIDTNSKVCNINSLNRKNKCRSIIEMYRQDSLNKTFNEELYKNQTIQKLPLTK